jgi:hypothetical protein
MAIKPSEAYVRFDEFEDVLASVELVALLAPFVREDPQYWKWIIVGAHSALQGAMVCAYVDSSGTSILKKQKKCRGKKPKRPKTPHEELADFEDLLKRCVRGSHTCEPLVLTNRQRRDIGRLHREFRNNFIHFMPQGWSIEKAVLPRIIAATLDAAEALMRRDYVTRLLDVDRQQRLQERLTVALAAARADLPSNIRASD